MREDKPGKKWNLGGGLFLRPFKKRPREEPQEAHLDGPPDNNSTIADIAQTSILSPTQTKPVPSPTMEQGKQCSSQMGLWTRAADSLDPADREKLEILRRSNQKFPNNHGIGSVVDDVNSTLDWAQKLKEQGREATSRPVVDKIIKRVLSFKSLGDAAVAFDKSGYAALAWSVVSFGLQLAVNAEDAREFVLSTSEVITRFMTKYKEYEQVFRGEDTEKEFDRLLTNVYKAILLYIIAVDEYLQQSRLGRVAHAINRIEDRSINSNKKAIDTADAEVRDWILIIIHKRNDENLSHIRRTLQDRPLPDIPSTSEDCMKSLAFPEMENRLNEIERAADGTCKWLLSHEKYCLWNDTECGLLCIKGKPGSGKSTLLCYAVGDAILASKLPCRPLIEHDKELLAKTEATETQPEVHPNIIILSFFFHDRGTDLQKTPLGLFRSLLHQILRSVPDAIPNTLLTLFQERSYRLGRAGENWNWEWRELRHFLKISLRKVLESHQVYLFIDALDECGEEDANEFTKSFYSWLRERPTQAQFHICFTCRHYPPLSLPQGTVEICLEEENKGDIATYVQTQLSTWSSAESLATIWTEITDRASGVFIWARLMVPRVLRLERRGENWKKIKLEIENTPQELDDLYRGLVKRMETDPNSFTLIKWICFAMKPLTLDELRWAIIVDPDYSERPASLRHYEDTADFATNCYMMEKKLKALSCGLAEAVPSSRVVQFIHQSVKDYFLKEGLAILARTQSLAIPGTDEADLEDIVHSQLSRTCIRYFSAEEIMMTDPTRLSISERASVFPFLPYAVFCWTDHVQQSERKDAPQADLVQYFGWPSERVVKVWADWHASLEWKTPFVGDWVRADTLLHVASRYKLMGLLIEILQSKDLLGNKIDTIDVENRTPLWWAVVQGHEAVVRLLLDNGAKVNKGNNLHAASSRRAEKIMRILLDYGADINAQDGRLGNALQVASCTRDEQTARLLLEYGADVNAKCGFHGHSLQAASFAGSEYIVRLLLEHGADINADWGRHGTALNAASLRGHRRIVEMLIEKGADVNAGKCNKALVLASYKGHGEIAHMLLDNGADVNTRSKDFGNSNALETASQRGHKQIVQTLLLYGAERDKSAA